MTSTHNIALIGPMGAGKSCIGIQLAKLLNKTHVDLDSEIIRTTCLEISEIFQKHGEEAFRSIESQALCTALKQSNQVISTGGGAVLRSENRNLLRAKSFVIYLHVSVVTQWQRLEDDQTRPLLFTNNRLQMLHDIAQARISHYEQAAHYTLSTDCLSIEDAAAHLALIVRSSYSSAFDTI